MLRSAIASTAFAIVVIAPSRAQTVAPHVPVGPHGIQVRHVAGHHVEFKVDSSGSISVWVLDAQGNALRPQTGATITLIEAPGCEHTVPLQADPVAQRLAAHVELGRYPSFEAVISLRIVGKLRHVRFRYPARE